MLHKLRAIIIDDERPAREEMADVLGAFTQIEIVGIATQADEAEKMIAAYRPDVIFLDIEIPPHNGFELLKRLSFLPHVVFCTAYDQFALQAFETDAVDYLLKPIQQDRLEKCISRLLQKQQESTSRDLSKSRILLQSGAQHYLTDLSEVYLLESDGNFVCHYFRDKKVLKFITLKRLQAELPKQYFLKINRSQLVNRNYIQTIKRNGRGLTFVLHNGMEIHASRAFAAAYKQ
jgi:two-component system, LytTR family, response regulator